VAGDDWTGQISKSWHMMIYRRGCWSTFGTGHERGTPTMAIKALILGSRQLSVCHRVEEVARQLLLARLVLARKLRRASSRARGPLSYSTRAAEKIR
jgi:hypothetical protein